MSSARAQPRTGSAALSAAGIVLLCLTAVLAAVLELLLVPLRAGATIAPVSVLFAVLSNLGLTRMGWAFAERTGAMAAPLVAWLVPMVLLALTARPEGDVLVPGSSGVQWVYYLSLLGGGIAGMVTISTRAPARRPPTARTR